MLEQLSSPVIKYGYLSPHDHAGYYNDYPSGYDYYGGGGGGGGAYGGYSGGGGGGGGWRGGGGGGGGGPGQGEARGRGRRGNTRGVRYHLEYVIYTICQGNLYNSGHIHMWQSQVENEHYSTVSGLIRLVISLECLTEITPDFLCPFMND